MTASIPATQYGSTFEEERQEACRSVMESLAGGGEDADERAASIRLLVHLTGPGAFRRAKAWVS